MNSSAEARPVSIADPALHWQAAESGYQCPAATRAWLEAPGSLTRLLKLASDGDFRVEVLAEGWQEIDNSALRGEFGPLAANHRFWSRRVLLLGRGQPWVQAHTLMPEHSLFSPLKQIPELGDRPLGEFLFEHQQLLRSHQHIAHHSGQTWGRKSLFFLFGKPIMVAEFFLPALLRLPLPESAV